jgi:hypothetical protein
MTFLFWFYLNGHINTYNNRQWRIENPHLVQEIPLHDVKVGLWDILSVRRIWGLVFTCIQLMPRDL